MTKDYAHDLSVLEIQGPSGNVRPFPPRTIIMQAKTISCLSNLHIYHILKKLGYVPLPVRTYIMPPLEVLNPLELNNEAIDSHHDSNWKVSGKRSFQPLTPPTDRLLNPLPVLPLAKIVVIRMRSLL